MAVHLSHEAIMACLSFSKISVEPFMFLNMNVFFLTFVTVPQIILDNICLLKHNETKCLAMFSGSFKEEFDIVQEQATLWFGGLLVMVTFIIILTLPFIGALSDYLGRYTAMFLSPVCQILQSLITLGIVLNGLPFPTWVLLLVASIPALVGDLSGFFCVDGVLHIGNNVRKDKNFENGTAGGCRNDGWLISHIIQWIHY